MLINNGTEYILGRPSRRSLKKLTSRRTEYGFFGGLFRVVICMAPGIIWVMLSDSDFMIFAGFMGVFFGICVGMLWLERPKRREQFAQELRRKRQLVTQDDVLFRLVMTHEVKTMLRDDDLDMQANVDYFFDEIQSNYCCEDGGWPNEIPDDLFTVEGHGLVADDSLKFIGDSPLGTFLFKPGVYRLRHFQADVRNFMIKHYGEVLERERRIYESHESASKASAKRVAELEVRLDAVTQCLDL